MAENPPFRRRSEVHQSSQAHPESSPRPTGPDSRTSSSVRTRDQWVPLWSLTLSSQLSRTLFTKSSPKVPAGLCMVIRVPGVPDIALPSDHTRRTIEWIVDKILLERSSTVEIVLFTTSTPSSSEMRERQKQSLTTFTDWLSSTGLLLSTTSTTPLASPATSPIPTSVGLEHRAFEARVFAEFETVTFSRFPDPDPSTKD